MIDEHNIKINNIETKPLRKTEVSTPNDITFIFFFDKLHMHLMSFEPTISPSFFSFIDNYTCTKWVLNNDLTLHLALTLGGVAI